MDVSGQRVKLTLSGHHVHDILAKGCALDLHPSVTYKLSRCFLCLSIYKYRQFHSLLPWSMHKVQRYCLVLMQFQLYRNWW